MITRLYANNFRCLVAFEAKFDSFGVLCGPNGAGKSSVFDALLIIKNLASGDSTVGGDGLIDVAKLEFTNWLNGKPGGANQGIQEFEIGLSSGGQNFEYLIHFEQPEADQKPRIIRERAACDKRELFDRDQKGVWIKQAGGAKMSFPLDGRIAALGSIQPTSGKEEIEILQKAISGLLILRLDPHAMENESRSESFKPNADLSNLTSWYRSLAQDQDWTNALADDLRSIWPDFLSFRLVDVGLQAKALQLRFDSRNGRDTGTLFFAQLSDGEKTLVALYMVRCALSTNAASTVLIDEPDNFVGLPELQPWVISMMELLDEEHQASIISHHPEILGVAGSEYGRYLWRDNHTSPTRIGPLNVPDGISSAEAIARGWVRA